MSQKIGLATLATDGVDLRFMDGTYVQMLVHPYIEQLAEHIHDFLDQTTGDVSDSW